MPLTSLPKDGGGFSLSPPKRGEGWGEGKQARTRLDLLTPTLSSFKGGEGGRLVKTIIPAGSKKEKRPDTSLALHD